MRKHLRYVLWRRLKVKRTLLDDWDMLLCGNHLKNHQLTLNRPLSVRDCLGR
jgi:hypothetical protein